MQAARGGISVRQSTRSSISCGVIARGGVERVEIVSEVQLSGYES